MSIGMWDDLHGMYPLFVEGAPAEQQAKKLEKRALLVGDQNDFRLTVFSLLARVSL